MLGTALCNNATRVMMLGSGELGKEPPPSLGRAQRGGLRQER